MKTKLYIILAALALAACTDTLTDARPADDGTADSGDGIGFSMDVVEMSQQLFALGQTRAAAGDTTRVVEDCPPQNRLLEGIGADIYVNRLAMPVVGGQAGAYTSPAADGAGTRASVDDIVTSAKKNFPDSVTIFGLAADDASGTNARHLFNASGTLIKRVRDWRTSVHWPYDKEKMKFYSIAPALEQTDMSVTTEPTFATAPQLHFIIPDDISRQRDLLYGTSAVIDVQNGPTGSGDRRDPNLGKDNKEIDLTYNHILTAVRFARGKLPSGFIITNIRLENIANEGTFDGSMWTLATESGGATIKNGHYDVPTYYKSERGGYGGGGDAAYTSSDEGYYIDKDQVLFLMPHTCSSDAKMIVTMLVPDDAAGMTLIEDDGGSTVTTPGTYSVLKYNSATGYLEGATYNSETKYKRYTEHTPSVQLENDKWLIGHTVTYLLSVQQLRAGYAFSVSSTSEEKEHDGAAYSSTFTVDSYAQKIDYTENGGGDAIAGDTPLSFSVLGYSSTEDGTPSLSARPTWLTDISIGAPAGNRYTVTYNFAPQQYDTSLPHGNHRDRLRANRRRDNVNLAAQDPNGNYFTSNSSLLETANCYIINRAGTYRFPMVYGNAKYIIPGGTPTQGTKTDFTGFHDHSGSVISDAWISANLRTNWTDDSYDSEIYSEQSHRTEYEFAAELEWSDVRNLLTNVRTSARYTDYIEFEVESGSLAPGNAVIALKGRPVTHIKRTLLAGTESRDLASEGTSVDAGYPQTSVDGLTTTTRYVVTTYNSTTLKYDLKHVEEVTTRASLSYETVWTWHIWATDEVYPNQLGDAGTSIAIGSNKLMPVNLGWVPDAMEWGSYSRREVWVTFKQNSGSNTFKVHFMQHARPDLITGHTTLYQWGRPTALPMLVSNMTDAATTVTLYDKNGDAIGSPTFSSATGISGAIQNPLQMLASWSPATTYWSSSQKTIYDPCPAGFRLPAAALFSVVGLTGSPVAGGSKLNMWADARNANDNGDVKNGEEKKGGWFYNTSRTSFDASALTDRYGINASTSEAYTYVPNPTMFYLPATGWWPAGSAGSAMKTAIADKDAARYWTGDNNTYLFVLPKKTEAGTVADWTSTYNTYSTSMSVRPMGEVPSY